MRFETIYASQYLVSRLDYARVVEQLKDDGDIVQLDLTTGQKVMLLLIERGMNLGEIQHYYNANSRKKVHTLMLIWVDMFLPRDGESVVMNDWMQLLVSLHGDKLYGYEVAGRDAFFFPVHMRGTGRKRTLRYGNIVNYAAIGGKTVNTLNPYMPGKWYVGGFEHDNQSYRTYSSGDIGTLDDPLQPYFDVLGLPRQADENAVKRAYRTLARLYHPDVSTSTDSDERMKRINMAYTTIMKDFGD